MRALRQSRELTQEQLAEQLGITVRYLAAIERGERNLSADTIDALAAQLGAVVVVTLEEARQATHRR